MRVVLLVCIFLIPDLVSATDSTGHRLSAGIASRRYAGFYWMNGAAAEWSPATGRLKGWTGGVTVLSSVIGSAFASRAIPVYQFDASVIRDFLKGKVHPRLQFNAGYVYAHYGPGFGSLTNQSLTLSPELGVAVDAGKMFRIMATVGYQLLRGNGIAGPGVVYPVYGQLKALLNLKAL